MSSLLGFDVELNDEDACDKCSFCNEIVDHDEHNLQECCNCDFKSMCWAEYKLHCR